MAQTARPVVFVHGLWLHASSWDPWSELFREAGYEPSAPGWPGEPTTVQEARRQPEAVAGRGVGEVVDHYTNVIAALPERPVVVGHSFGGMIAQHLLARGAAAAAVAIDPAPIKGVFYLPPSAVRVALVALRNPANRNGSVALTREQFRYGFGNALPADESDRLWERWTIPSPGKPLFEAAVANFASGSPAKVDTHVQTRGPLLLMAGTKDHAVPATTVKATRRLHGHSPARTDYRELPGRGHSLTIDPGWREVADTALGWLREQRL